MAIVIPSALELVAYEDFVGDMVLDDQPLDTILDMTNFLYATHKPALWNLCPINPAATHTHDWVWPAVASADALTYDVAAYVYAAASKVGTIDIDLRYGPTSSGAWTAIVGWNPKTISLGGGGATEAWITAEAALPASAGGFWKLEVDDGGTGANTQVQCFAAMPVTLAAIAAGVKASGFKAYDNTMLLSADGGTIHTELFERAVANVRAVLRDRQQMVFSYVDELTNPNYTYAQSLVRDGTYWQWVFRGRTSVRGQGGGPCVGARILVQARADDSSAGGNGVLIVGEEGGQKVTIDCDDADNDGYLDLQSDEPVLYCTVHPYASAGAVTIRYVTGRWLPGEDT